MLNLKNAKFFVLLTLLVLACQPKFLKKSIVALPEITAIPDSAFITVTRENVRQKPNGRILGHLKRNQKIFIDRRTVNWLKFHNSQFDSAYVWAPSAGFEYINLYSPFTYYDSSAGVFYPKEYLQRLFGSKGKIEDDYAKTYQLFYSNLGLGSHEETVLEVTTESSEEVKHGITLFIRKADEKIYQVEVDFFRPVKGVKSILKKCDLIYRQPSAENEGHVIWDSNVTVNGLVVDLERKEWKSPFFSSVRYKLPGVE